MGRILALALISISMFGCATINSSSYQPSTPTYSVESVSTTVPKVEYLGADPMKIRFNVTIDKQVADAVQEQFLKEMNIRGFSIEPNAPISINVVVNSIVSPKTSASIYATNAKTGASARKDFDYKVTMKGETKVKSIYDAEGIWSHVRIFIRDFLESPEFKAILESNGETQTAPPKMMDDAPPLKPQDRTPSPSTLLQMSKGHLSATTTTPDEQDIKNAWMKRGGMITGSEWGFGISGFSDETNISESGVEINSSVDAIGYTFRGGLNFINLSPPKYQNGRLGNWSALYFGAVFDYNYMELYVTGTTRFPGQSSQYFSDDLVQQNLNLSFPVGVKFGLGTGADAFTWKGVSIGANWRPSIQWVIPDGVDAETMQSTNLGGFGFDFDFGRMTTSIKKVAPDPFTRISVIFLPPIDDMPAFFSFTIARLTY